MRGYLWNREIYLLHDRATPHTAVKARNWLEKIAKRLLVILHTVQSLFVLISFFLSSLCVYRLQGSHSTEEEESYAAFIVFLKWQFGEIHREEIFRLLHYWGKCLNVQGDYVVSSIRFTFVIIYVENI